MFSSTRSVSTVLTGTVTSLANGPRGTLIVTVTIIRTYKAGRLTITQVGEAMSVKLVSQCRKCPLLRRGMHSLVLLVRSIRSDGSPTNLFIFLWQVPTSSSWVRWMTKVVEPCRPVHSQPHTKLHMTGYYQISTASPVKTVSERRTPNPTWRTQIYKGHWVTKKKKSQHFTDCFLEENKCTQTHR